MHRRQYVSVVATAVTGMAGCTRSGQPSATTHDGPIVQAGPGEYEHDILFNNTRNRPATVTLTVTRGGDRLLRETSRVPAATDATLAGFTRETLPEDSRSVRVRAVDDQDRAASVETAIYGCLGHVMFYYDSDGTLEGTYAIC